MYTFCVHLRTTYIRKFTTLRHYFQTYLLLTLFPNIYDENDEMVQYKCEWDDDVRTRQRRIAFSKKDGTGYVFYMYFED